MAAARYKRVCRLHLRRHLMCPVAWQPDHRTYTSVRSWRSCRTPCNDHPPWSHSDWIPHTVGMSWAWQHAAQHVLYTGSFPYSPGEIVNSFVSLCRHLNCLDPRRNCKGGQTNDFRHESHKELNTVSHYRFRCTTSMGGSLEISSFLIASRFVLQLGQFQPWIFSPLKYMSMHCFK